MKFGIRNSSPRLTNGGDLDQVRGREPRSRSERFNVMYLRLYARQQPKRRSRDDMSSSLGWVNSVVVNGLACLSSAALGDRGTHSHPHPRRPVRRENVADVEADDLGKAQAGAEGERADRVVADIAGGRPEDRPLLVGRQGGGGEVRQCGLLAAQVPSVGDKVKENASL
jgi:hypothetical protein